MKKLFTLFILTISSLSYSNEYLIDFMCTGENGIAPDYNLQIYFQYPIREQTSEQDSTVLQGAVKVTLKDFRERYETVSTVGKEWSDWIAVYRDSYTFRGESKSTISKDFTVSRLVLEDKFIMHIKDITDQRSRIQMFRLDDNQVIFSHSRCIRRSRYNN